MDVTHGKVNHASKERGDTLLLRGCDLNFEAGEQAQPSVVFPSLSLFFLVFTYLQRLPLALHLCLSTMAPPTTYFAPPEFLELKVLYKNGDINMQCWNVGITRMKV